VQNLNYVDETVREIIRTEIDPPEKLDHRFSGVGKGGTLQGRHLRGENLEFWRLHCNVLA